MKPINTNGGPEFQLPSSRLFHKEEVVGKTVIDSGGRVAGRVKDVLFGLNGTVMLVVEKKDGAELQVPMSGVVGISEFVITRSEGLPEAEGTSAGAGPRTCKFCGHELGSSVYCPACGKSQV